MSQRPGQEAPEPGLDLTDFPVDVLGGRTVFRAHDLRGPGWFSSSLSGRFDLKSPRGTLYVGETLALAIREKFGTRASKVLEHEEVADFEVSKIAGIEGTFADVSQSEAARYGVTGELPTMQPYDIPQAWAAAFVSHGLDGVRYVPRFTPGNDSAWAVFGPAGAHDIGSLEDTLSGPEACLRAGVRVAPQPPHSPRSLTVEY